MKHRLIILSIALFMVAALLGRCVSLSDFLPVQEPTEIVGQDTQAEREPEELPQVPALQPAEGVAAYHEITAENIRLLNRERERSGLPALNISEDLSAVADWIARAHLESGDDVASEEIRIRLDRDPGFAVVSFSMNRSSATGSYGNNFPQWFAENRAGDVTGSEGLRNNLLDPGKAFVGVACVGASFTEDGRQQYKMVFVWIFTPAPPPVGLTSYQQIAQDNLAILNDERAARGLSRLSVHSELTALALEKARDLVQHDYFDHYSPRLGSPHEMITARVVPLPQMTAENLWKLEGTYHADFLIGTARQAHEGLMNSDGHRKNLLHPDYTHVGVACVGGIVERPEGKLYQLVLVQLFIRE